MKKIIKLLLISIIGISPVIIFILYVYMHSDSPTSCVVTEQKCYISDDGGYYVSSTKFVWTYPDKRQDSILWLQICPDTTINMEDERLSFFFADFDIDGNVDVIRLYMKPTDNKENDYNKLPQIWITRNKETGILEWDHGTVQITKFLTTRIHKSFNLRDKALLTLK